VRGFLKSFQHAFRGLFYILQYERNARVHLLIMIAVIFASFALHLSAIELVAVAFSIVIVFVAEILNSAIEELADMICPEEHDRIRHVKDITAAAVLVAAAAASIIGLVIFGHRLLT
jgi:diacylglycerol kinase